MDICEIGEMSKTSCGYPPLLRDVKGAPDPLYFLGKHNPKIFENTLAVVGSRAVTMYGEWVVENIVKEVASCGITIVSGFMYGVDALSHRAALEVEGKTIAVMAGGITSVFPKYQQDLYDEIALKGLIVSEFKTKGAEGKWMFARRNRIVAGLSHALLVVEAGEASGSLITANYAKQYGRQILAIPGNLNMKNSYGTTQLLREGAKLVSCAEDILEFFFVDNNYRKEKLRAVNKRYIPDSDEEISHSLLEVLTLESLTADEMAVKLRKPPAEILKHLTTLCLMGAILERDGKYYAN